MALQMTIHMKGASTKRAMAWNRDRAGQVARTDCSSAAKAGVSGALTHCGRAVQLIRIE
jgi:hypothetical protein